MKGKRVVLLIVIGGIIIAVIGTTFVYRYGLSNHKSDNSPLRTITVQRGDITETISATGSIIANSDLDIGAKKSGAVIKELLVEEGQFVKEGQVLVRLEDEEEKLSVLKAENALKDALLELESARVSHASSTEIKRREREVAEKRLEFKLAKKELDDTVIKAPFSGIVSKVYVEKGEIIAGVGASSSNKILHLIDTSRLFAEVNVDEVDISKVKLGQGANVKVDAYPDEVFSGKVVSIAREATTSGGLVVVKDGEVLAELPLPVAGLVSDQPLETVVEKFSELTRAVESIGCTLPDPFAAMSFLSLVPIPQIRLTDKGLVDATKFEFIDLFADS